MRGHNQVWISGTVVGQVVTGETRDKNPCCSFPVSTHDGGRPAVRVRINVYGQLALLCETTLVSGKIKTVSVVGELMNRDGKYGPLTEVRAVQVSFPPSLQEDENVGQEGREEGLPVREPSGTID